MKQMQDFCPLWGVWHAEKMLGRGSFGTVWQMRREEMGQVYYAAVKHISIPQTPDEVEMLKSEGVIADETSTCKYFDELTSSILYEIKMMDALKGHTNIVSYEDYLLVPKEGLAGYDLFIRMELLTGLDKWKNAHGMRREDVIRLGVDIATAMDVLNKKGLVHRDIKPQNILVNDIGDFKLADFGTARALNNASTAMSKKGTYNYMAPEVFRGDSANQTVDVYSLGMVLYRLTNKNRGPFLSLDASTLKVEETEIALHRRMRGDALPPPAYADEALAKIILKACAFDPKERYQSGAALRDALLHVDDPVVVTPPASDPADKPRGKVDPEPRPEPQKEPKKPNAPKKSGRKKWLAVVALIVVALGIGTSMLGGDKASRPVSKTPFKTAATPTPTPRVTDAPTPTPTKKVTLTPTPTKKVTPSPAPKATPTPTAVPSGILPLAPVSQYVEYTSGNFRYMVADDGTAHITGYNNESAVADERISEYLDGYRVSAIRYGAFSDTPITSLFIPNNVQHVDYEAFINCYKLEKFSVNSDHPTLKVDGGALIDKQTKTLIKYPAASLRRSVVIPEGVEVIGPQGFAYSQVLYSVKLPESLKRIDGVPFYLSSSLTYIDVDKDHPVFGVQDGYLYNKQNNELLWHIQGRKDTECVLPDWITGIGEGVFQLDQHVKSVIIPAGVKSIGADAFAYCPNLTVTVVEGSYAHQYCQQSGVRYQLASAGKVCAGCGFVNEGGDSVKFCMQCGLPLK